MRRTLIPVLALGAIAAATIAIDLGSIHRFDQADSIVPTLCSLNHWTLYYWAQDRMGMLLPLLAIPVRNPLHNLLLQSGLNIFAGLVCFFLLPRTVLSWRASIPIGAVSLLAYLMLASDRALWNLLLISQPYGLSLSLAAIGAILLESEEDLRPSRIAASAAFLLLAFWVNLAVIVPMAPLFLIRSKQPGVPLFRVPHRPTRSLVLLSLACLAVCTLVSRAYTWLLFPAYSATPLGLLMSWQWPRSLASFVAAVGRTTPASLRLFWAALLLVGLVRLSWRAGAASHVESTLRAVAALLLAAAAAFVVPGTSRHVALNAYAERYAAPSLLLLTLALAVLAVYPLAAGAPVRLGARVSALLLLAIPLAARARFGAPSVEGVRRDLQVQFGDHLRDVEASGADLLLGDYWTVWPTVFMVQMARYESGKPKPFWGLTRRAQATESGWRPLLQPGRRIVALAGDPSVSDMQALLRLPPLVLQQRQGNVLVYEVAVEALARRMETGK